MSTMVEVLMGLGLLLIVALTDGGVVDVPGKEEDVAAV